MTIWRQLGVCFALATMSSAWGQDVPGLPIRDAGSVREVPAEMPAEIPATPSALDVSPTMQHATAGGTTLVADATPEQLREMVQRAQAVVEGAQIKPPPAHVEAKAGVNEIIPIGMGSINRLRTNFTEPKVKTTSEAMLEVEGSVIYAASNTTDPISVFIHDAGNPEQAISLTLLPRGIPPIDISVTLEGFEAVSLPVAAKAAEKWELDQPYVEAISEAMVMLAHGTVPDGYGLEILKHPMHPLMPHCDFNGAVVTPSQILTGSSLVVLVARVQNVRGWTIEIDESRCMAEGVLATAAWPRLVLSPGEETELYVVVQRPEEGSADRMRPKVIGGRHGR